MKTEMTAGDKKLIVFLALFVVVVAISYWGIRPFVKSMNDYKEKTVDIENKVSEDQLTLTMLPVEQKNIESMQSAIDEAKQEYFEPMTSSDVDRLFTTKALGYNLKCLQLNIDKNDLPAEVTAYKYSALYEQDRIRSMKEEEASSDDYSVSIGSLDEDDDSDADSDADDADDEESDETASAAAESIYSIKLDMQVMGDKKDLEAFLEELNNYDKKLLVRSYSWSEVEVPRDTLRGMGGKLGAKASGITAASEEGEEIAAPALSPTVTVDVLTVSFEVFMYCGE